MMFTKRIGNPVKPFVFVWLLLLFGNSIAFSQNVAINADGSQPDKNAILDIKSNNKGVLIPRISSEARMRIPNTQGLIVYDVNTNSFWYNTGKTWQNLAPAQAMHAVADSAWLLTGNSNTVDGTHFLGTINNVPLNIRVNNQRSGRIDPVLDNTFWGYRSGFGNPTGRGNTAVGSSALYTTTTGFDNTAVGSFALLHNTTGWSNSAFGRLALQNNSTGTFNTAIGQSALLGNLTGNENVAVGVGASLGNYNSNGNTAVGTNSQFFHQGSQNTSLGKETLAFYDGGTGNTAIGYHALRNVSIGNSYNTGVGHEARIDFDRHHSTAIGSGTYIQGDNSTALGSGAVANASNKVRIGNAAVTVIEGQVPFTFPSDGRFKFGVQEDVKGLDFILQLRPVTYHFDTKRFDAQVGAGNSASDAAYDEATAIRRSGFIAQEVDQAAQRSGYDFSGIIKPKTEKEHYSLSYDAFVVPLVKAVQEQQAVINAQQKKIDDQQQVNDALNKKLGDMQRELEEIKKLLKSK